MDHYGVPDVPEWQANQLGPDYHLPRGVYPDMWAMQAQVARDAEAARFQAQMMHEAGWNWQMQHYPPSVPETQELHPSTPFSSTPFPPKPVPYDHGVYVRPPMVVQHPTIVALVRLRRRRRSQRVRVGRRLHRVRLRS